MEATDVRTLTLTQEEAMELFLRCLGSAEADTASSTSALQKLARAVVTGRKIESPVRVGACYANP